MLPDVADLRAFYQSALGKRVEGRLSKHLHEHLGHIDGLDLLGLGFGAPYLKSFLGKATRTINVMPKDMGVLRWPEDEPNLSLIADYNHLPFDDLFFDRILMVHYLEHAENTRQALREAWRVLSDHGRIYIIIPNRKGLWARRDTTPFGSGQPYTKRQILKLLKETCFTPLNVTNALYMLPLTKNYALNLYGLTDKLGPYLFKSFSGVLIIEAQKQVYGVTPLVDPVTSLKNKAIAALNLKKHSVKKPQQSKRSK